MKKVLFAAVIAACTFAFADEPAELKTIRAGNKTVDIKIGDEMQKGGWVVTPEMSPDVLTVPVGPEGTTVTFISDVDSISFDVKPGDSRRFYIDLNGVKALTGVDAILRVKSASFSNGYIKDRRGKWFVEVPEVQELVHIVFAITPTGMANKQLVNQETAYYKEVMNHFSRFASEPVVVSIEELLKHGFYVRLKMDSCAYVFDGDRIVNGGIYDRLNWDAQNHVKPLVQNLEAFAAKTGFRKFYAEHKPYYDSLVAELIGYMPMDKQWKWCEKHFDRKYDSYRITFSPLVSGYHSTNHFEDNGFKETVMFICAARHSPDWNEAVTEGMNTRIVFTEIDHNYVNPISDTYAAQIDPIFSDRARWTKSGFADDYHTPLAVFNEYMTWAVFTLYVMDHFSDEDFKTINGFVEKQMAEYRGFHRFPEFNRKVLDLYKASSSKSIEELYEPVLAWCRDLK